jgi:hypothetical protein
MKEKKLFKKSYEVARYTHLYLWFRRTVKVKQFDEYSHKYIFCDEEVSTLEDDLLIKVYPYEIIIFKEYEDALEEHQYSELQLDYIFNFSKHKGQHIGDGCLAITEYNRFYFLRAYWISQNPSKYNDVEKLAICYLKVFSLDSGIGNSDEINQEAFLKWYSELDNPSGFLNLTKIEYKFIQKYLYKPLHKAASWYNNRYNKLAKEIIDTVDPKIKEKFHEKIGETINIAPGKKRRDFLFRLSSLIHYQKGTTTISELKELIHEF